MPALSACTILVLGDFGHPTSKIRQWIKYHGGSQVMRLNNSTTHVICSEKNWKVEHPTVLAAIKLDDAKTKTKLSSNSNDSKKLNIVTWDWLEDCTIKRRCYGAKKYEWRTPMRKPSRLEELIRQWGEITGVEMSPRLVYGPGGKGASFNGNVKGSSKVKRKGNEKGKGKTLSLVEKDLVKANYSVYSKDSILYDVVLTIFDALKQRFRIRIYHKVVTTKSKKPAVATTTNFYAATMTYSTSATTAKTRFLPGADIGSGWEPAYEAFKEVLEKKTDTSFEKLTNGVRGEVMNGWTVLKSGEGGSVVHWVQVGVNWNKAKSDDEAIAAGHAEGQKVEGQDPDGAYESETGSMEDFIDDASTIACSECRTHQSEELGANDVDTAMEEPVEHHEEITHDTSTSDDDAQSSVLSSIQDDAFQAEEQAKQSEDEDDMPLRHTRGRTIGSKEKVFAPTIMRDVVTTTAVEEDGDEDDMPLSRKRARQATVQKTVDTENAPSTAAVAAPSGDDDKDDMPLSHKRARRDVVQKKATTKNARHSNITSTSADEGQDENDSASETETETETDTQDEDGDESDYQDKDNISLSRKRARRGTVQTEVSAKKQKTREVAVRTAKEKNDLSLSRKSARKYAPRKNVAAPKKKTGKGAVRAAKRAEGSSKMSDRGKRASRRAAR